MESSPNSRAKKVLGNIAADVRQGIVGNLAWVALAALVVLLLSLAGGTVPAWTLGATIGIAIILLGLTYTKLRRRLDHRGGELDEARRQRDQVAGDMESYRQQLAQLGAGQSPMSQRAQGFVRRIRALRQSAEQTIQTWPYSDEAMATEAERGIAEALIEDMREAIGEERTVVNAARMWVGAPVVRERHTSQNLLTTLGQLEALAETFGAEDLT